MLKGTWNKKSSFESYAEESTSGNLNLDQSYFSRNEPRELFLVDRV